MLGILHLSDIHINDKGDYILKNIESIFNASKNILKDSDKIIIVITGDIANRGLDNQYDLAFNFLYELKDKFERYCNKEVYIIMAVCLPKRSVYLFESEQKSGGASFSAHRQDPRVL